MGITRCFQHALQRLGRAAPDADALRQCVGPPLRETLAELLGGGDHVEDAVRHYRERYAATGLFENEVYPGVPDMLRALRTAGHPMWIVTSKPHVYARRIVEHFGLSPWLEGVYGSELDGTRSDKGELIAHALRSEGIPAAETWMIGDRRHDVLGARRNGVVAVGVLWGYGSEDELRAVGAAHLVATPGELRGRVPLPT